MPKPFPPARFRPHVSSLRFAPPAMLAVGLLAAVGLESATAQDASSDGEHLPGTRALSANQPLADRMVAGASRFLDAQLDAAAEPREQHWAQVMQQPAAEREATRRALRERLAYLIGARDARAEAVEPKRIAPLGGPEDVARGADLAVQEIRWPVLEGYVAEGIAVVPEGRSPRATVILLPDADTAPESLAGLDQSDDPAAGVALSLAAAGCRVLIPAPISRRVEPRGGRAELTDREYVYRCTYVLGRHPLGLEVQGVRALVDGLQTAEDDDARDAAPVAVAGFGEGGLVALLAAAVDERIDAVLASGAWGNRHRMPSEPIERNVFGLLSEFGDAGLACLVGPRRLIVETARFSEIEISAPAAAPGRLISPTRDEVDRAVGAVERIAGVPDDWLRVVEPPEGRAASDEAVEALLAALGVERSDVALAPRSKRAALGAELAERAERLPDAERRRARQLDQIEAITERWIRTSRDGRDAMRRELDTDSLEAYRASTEPQRERLENEVLGRFDQPLREPDVRSRLWQRAEKWTGWEVEMDTFGAFVAGGILLVPHDVSDDQPRPVVVCVHGLEGQPEDAIRGDHRAYHNFAARLCERGFVVFCPQQPYRGGDAFRVLQRKANPLGKTLFSLIVPQHRQFLGWLGALPWVDPERIAFYGLSYGGKSAMRIPAVVPEYGPTICSADFNEWVLKNASPRDSFSYVWTGEYEIFEFDLAGTFSYAEMAALICPRPFMVERGHFDGVAEDRWVAFEYAPVRHLYAARLGIPERTEIEWFVGPHTINAQGTFAFLHRHLDWPEP